MRLFWEALIKFLAGVALCGLLLFLPAATLAYPGAWLFLALLFLPMLLLGAVLLIKAPDLLRRRLDSKEKEGAQRGVVAVAGLVFLSAFVLSALDFRFAWSRVPTALVAVASALFLLGYAMYAEVMRENAYLARTVKVEAGQALITTGLYGIIRHPMYLATLLMFLPIPLILGSFLGLIPLALYPVAILFRIGNEERVLTAELAGYAEYKTKVKYRLIPFIF